MLSKSTLLFTWMMLVALILSAPAMAAKFTIKDGPELDIWGRAQLTFERFDRESGKSDDLEFGADRVRFGTKMKWGAWKAALQFDANSNGNSPTSLNRFIRDAYAEYKFADALSVRLGQFKTPSGMANNESSSRLPMAKRTMVSRLAIDRALGVALKGKYIGGSKETGGFGYNIGVYNVADRGKAVANINSSQKGDDMSYAASIFYDYGKVFHIETGTGTVERAGGPEDESNSSLYEDGMRFRDSEDYSAWNLGARYKRGPVRIRAEYITSWDVKGIDEYDEEAWFIEGSYRFNDLMEGVLRWQNAECENCDNERFVNGKAVGDDEELSRFEAGVNFFFGQKDTTGRIQLNYVKVGRDEEDYSGVAGGGNNRYDALLGQLQFMF